MENLEALSDDELATVVVGSSLHRFQREKLGMCGCGLVHTLYV